MKLKISFYFLFLVVVLNQVVFSQEDLFRKSFKITGGLPFAIANKDFKELMKSVYIADVYSDFKVYKNILIGVSGTSAQFNDADLARKTDITRDKILSAHMNLGYEKFLSKNKIFSFSFQGGKTWENFVKTDTKSDTIANLLSSSSLSYGAVVMLNYIVEEKAGIGFYLSYRLINSVFDPEKLGMYVPTNKKTSPTQYWSMGVNFIIGY